MSKAVIGALRVTLGLDSAQFQTGLKSAQSGMQRFASLARAGALAVGAAMVTGAGIMAAAMKGIIDDADEMYKLSQAIGVPIEELSKLRYAADLAGVDLDALGKAVKRLSAGMLDSTEQATGTAARAFTALGINVRDTEGKMRSASSVIAELAGKFSKMPDGVEKTALAMRIFGKSGADMIPLLNAGSAGLQEMYAEAEELGLVLDEETAKAAERFNDNLTRLGKVKDGIITKITAGMMPALENLSDALVGAAKNTSLLQSVGAFLGRVLQIQYTAVAALAGAFSVLARSIGAAANVAGRMARLDFRGAWEAAQTGIVDVGKSIAGTIGRIREIWAPPSGAPPVVDGLELIDTAANGARRSTERLTKAQSELWDVFESGKRTFAETRNPAEQYAETLKRISRELEVGAIDQETYNRALREAQDLFERDDPVQQSRRSLEEKRREFEQDSAEDRMNLAADHRADMEAATYDGIRGGLEAAADGNLGEYLANRIRNALFDRLASSLTDMFMGNGKQSGGGILGSLGSWGSSLKSAFSMFSSGFPGFATGGSFKVGGAPGKDKNFVGMNLTKGEMVDIRKPGQDAGGATHVIVTPSPYFDTRVQRVASPEAAKAGMQSAAFSRQAVPADEAKRRRFALAGK